MNANGFIESKVATTAERGSFGDPGELGFSEQMMNR
jgi:hypothetical protein